MRDTDESMRQELLAGLPALRIPFVIGKGGSNRGEGDTCPLRFIGAEFGTGDRLDQAVNREQAVGGLGSTRHLRVALPMVHITVPAGWCCPTAAR
jgi:hypothetical protein